MQRQIGEHHWEYGLYMADLFMKSNGVNDGFRYLVSVGDNWSHSLEYSLQEGIWTRRTEYHNQDVGGILTLFKQIYPQDDNPIFRNSPF